MQSSGFSKGPSLPRVTSLDVKNTQTAYFAYTRRLTSYLDTRKSPAESRRIPRPWVRDPPPWAPVPYNGQTIATAKWAAPSALLEYKFFSESTALRPYVGVGVNYTSFYDRRITQAGEQATGGPTRISLTSSVGPVGTRWA